MPNDEKTAPASASTAEKSSSKAYDRVKHLSGHIPGPGRPRGSKNRYNQTAIADFVANFRSDLASDWQEHGAAFVAKCRTHYPQIYSALQVRRLEDALAAAGAASEGPLVISWQERPPTSTTPSPEPPKLIAYHKPEVPADLSPEAWSAVVRVTEIIRNVAPSDVEAETVFGLIEGWLREHFISGHTESPAARAK